MKIKEMKTATTKELCKELKDELNGFMDGMWDSMNLEDKTVGNRLEVMINLITLKIEGKIK